MKQKKRSERHHWWPECVSSHWKDEGNGVTWLLPNGSERRSTPENFGVIGNGHMIKLGNKSGEHTPWDENFEPVFQNADDSFPSLISWLQNLTPVEKFGHARQQRFVSQDITDDLFRKLIECVVSLAIRSPSTRDICASVAEMVRGGTRLPEPERNAIIGLNMKHMHIRTVEWYGLRGKAACIYSPYREFIFGDGFYHNLATTAGPQMSPRVLVPITPRMSLLYVIPRQYREVPRFSTLMINAEEADALNNVIQIYANEAIFFSRDRPILTQDFRNGGHMRFKDSRNVVEDIVHSMPGVQPRDTSLDYLSDLLEKEIGSA